MKNKALGFWFACAAAVLAAVTLIVVLVYGGRGGQVNGLVIAALICAIVCEASLFFGEKPWTDFTGIIGAVLLAYALMTVLSDGIWNIAESINGIRMVGLPELAGMNYTIAGINLAAIITAILSCFTKKSK